MQLKTYNIAGVNYAMLKVLGIKGGFIGKGSSTQKAILDAFNRYNWYKITTRNQDQELTA